MTEAAVFTIGYEGRSADDFIAALRVAGVQLLIDTRHRATSRKRGFAKSRLAANLDAVGIRYEHRRELGTPPELMEDLRRAGAYDLGVYADHLDSRASVVEAAAREAEGLTVALLCFERDPRVCHRSVVADRVARMLALRVVHI